MKRWRLLAAALLLAGCTLPPGPPAARYQPVDWSALPGWPGDDPTASFEAWKSACPRLQKNLVWAELCAEAKSVGSDPAMVREFLQNRLQPLRLVNADGSDNGLITGYYEPVYPGSLTRTATARHPLYGQPKDLITVALDEVYPELKGKRLRGKLTGQKLVPYPDRAAIARNGIDAPILAWLNDPLDVQFMQVQGSGRVQLADGKTLRLGYADQNGRPYQPIGRWLVQQEELAAGEVTMQSIRSWAAVNPERINELLDSNPSYVFFRVLPSSNQGPIGSLGQPLTAERSIAVDPSVIPLGSLVYLASTRPDNQAAMQRLVAAQDTGGAIKGSVRADFFWGTGQAAGELAGTMKQRGNLWLLWPKDSPLP